MNRTFKISYKIVDFLNKSLNTFQNFPSIQDIFHL